MRRPVLAAALVAAVLAVTVGVGEGLGTSNGDRVPTSTVPTPLLGTRVVCPDVTNRSFGQVSRITEVGAATPAVAPDGLAARGAVGIARASGGASRQVLQKRGTAVLIPGTRTAADLLLTATGRLAPGFAVDQVGRSDGGAYRGIDGVSCVAPGGEAWLIGATTVVGAHAQLRLVNVDRTPAVVDVVPYGAKGPVQAPDGRGVTVKPQSTKVVALETLAPGQAPMLVHVVGQSGRVAVSLRQQNQKAATPLGVDWIPQAAPPATRTVIPGVLSGDGPRRLLLGNPGEVDATAKVTAVRTDGSFVPRGFAAFTVRAGSVRVVDVTKVMAGRASAFVIAADQPLVTGGSMSTNPGAITGIAEQAWSAAAPPLSGPTVVGANSVSGRTSSLLLSAPDADADVTVTTFGAKPRTARVHIPAHRSVQYNLLPLAGSSAWISVTVTPSAEGGPVYASRQIVESGSRGLLFTVLPLRTPASVVDVRTAYDDQRVGVNR